MTDKDPKDQYQIGDDVLYKPEGIITRILGYEWSAASASRPDRLPTVIAYLLDCGVSVPAETIEKYDRSRIVERKRFRLGDT